jgi:hypothetical protein
MAAAMLSATLLLTACGGSKAKPTPTPTKPAATIAAPTTASGTPRTSSPTTVSGTTSAGAEPTANTTSLEATFGAQMTQIASFTGTIDACKLVSRADAEKIIGKKLSGDPFHGMPGFPNMQAVCNYNPETVPGTAVVDGETVQLFALTKDDLQMLGMTANNVKQAFADSKASAKDEDGYTDVSGLGDDAYYTNDSGLNVLKGDTGINVKGLPLDKAKEFAKKALDNL